MTVIRPDRFHAFSCLELTLSDSALDGVRTDHVFELRATPVGADVWRSSVLHAAGGSCSSGERFVGRLSTRRVIDLLAEIERTGVYEALPNLGIVAGSVDPEQHPTVTMRLTAAARSRLLLDRAPAEREVVHELSEAVRRCIELAMEHALTSAG